jgi:hypothetical protein
LREEACRYLQTFWRPNGSHRTDNDASPRIFFFLFTGRLVSKRRSAVSLDEQIGSGRSNRATVEASCAYVPMIVDITFVLRHSALPADIWVDGSKIASLRD